MATTSSFTPIQPASSTGTPGWRRDVTGALDGSAFALPSSLGAVTLVYSRVAPDLLTAGVLALILSMAWIHATAARNARPVLFSARFFEATTLAAMIDQAVAQFPGWGLPDTPAVRLALLCLLGTGAGLAVGVLYLLRADRFTRFIPAPVFAGFSNSIALALLVSQGRALWQLVSTPGSVAAVLSIAAAVLASGLALRRWRPQWPGAALSLVLGLLLGLAWLAVGRPTPTMGSFGWSSVLPLALADFSALAVPGVRVGSVAAFVAGHAAILGAMMFINTTMASQVVGSQDNPRPRRRRDALATVIGMTLAGLLGSAPLSGSLNSSVVASRTGRITAAVMGLCALVAALVYLSGVVGLIPLAAICGAMLCEAWLMVDRASVRLCADWLRRRAMTANGREDLALIAAVMAAAVLLNMVAAIFVGLLLGLISFAARNARQPVRHVWSGLQVSSNCARSREDLNLLARHGGAIRVFELEGDLFFGVADGLQRVLIDGSQGMDSVILDWARVRHIDSSVALALAGFERQARERGLLPIHAGAGLQGGNAAPVLLQQLPHARLAPDLDRALEQAENDVIELRGEDLSRDPTSLIEAAALFAGLDTQDQAHLESIMSQRLYKAGDVIMAAGEPGDELMLVLFGSASVVLRSADGKDTRLAGVRRGATLGDMAFLENARRSATVVAEEDTTVAVLGRGDYDLLCAARPRLVQCLLANVALSLAARLRHTNQLAVARAGAR